jgi:flagellar hook-associated protein FlgK
MSDEAVAKTLDNLERLLETLLDRPDPQAVADWHASFREAVAGAERGPRWEELRTRAKELGRRLDERTRQLVALRGAIRQELQAHERGRRALKGYRQPMARR